MLLRVHVFLLIFVLFCQLSFAIDKSGSEKSCGIVGSATSLIFGGILSSRGKYPWLAAIYLAESDNFICGGTLLSSKLVSTAAHCIQDKRQKQKREPFEVLVKLGKYDLTIPYERGSVIAYPDAIYIHPDWKHFTDNYDSDIAIISLGSAVQFTYLISPICLRRNNAEPTRNRGVVVGWGRSESGALHETKPREIEIDIKTNEKCFLKNPRIAAISSESTFCAGNTELGKTVCLGDSGSGMICSDNGIWYLEGIVSASLRDGAGCDITNDAIYTNVPKMMNWISQIFSQTNEILQIPSKVTPILPVVDNKRNNEVFCYVAFWANYRKDDGTFTLDNIKPELCTTLVYCYAGLDESGDNLKSLDPWLDLEENYGKGNFKKLSSFKNSHPGLKVLLSIGGWNEGSEKYSKLAADAQRRQRFAQNSAEFLQRHNFDGLNFYWEYPAFRGGAPADKENYVHLMKDISDVYKPQKLYLCSTLRSVQGIADHAYDILNIAKYVDSMHIMTFDLSGPWDKKVGWNAPLYGDGILNIENIVNYFIDKGAPPEKLILGIPFYGRTFVTQNSGNIGDPADDDIGFQGSLVKIDGFYGYNEFCKEKSQNKWSISFNEQSWEALATLTKRGETRAVTFDSPRSVAVKVRYAIGKKLGGVWAWSIDTDDFKGHCGPDATKFADYPNGGPSRTEHDFPLLRTIKEAFSLLSSDKKILDIKVSQNPIQSVEDRLIFSSR